MTLAGVYEHSSEGAAPLDRAPADLLVWTRPPNYDPSQTLVDAVRYTVSHPCSGIIAPSSWFPLEGRAVDDLHIFYLWDIPSQDLQASTVPLEALHYLS